MNLNRDGVLGFLVLLPFLMGAAAAPADQPGQVAFTFQDPEIVESSGLVLQDGLVLTTNDSGDVGRVFAVDPAIGETVGVTRWSDDPVDVEALAPAGDGEVWVGDIGDNSDDRDDVQVARVPVGRGDRTVDPTTYDLVYAGGPVNAETLMSDPTTGRLYVASKSVFGGRLFEAPARLDPDRPNRLRPIGDVLPIATDGVFLPDGRHVVIRDYSVATVYTFPALEEVATFRLPTQDQGEGLTVDGDGGLLVSTEGQGTDVLRVRLPDAVRRAMAAADPSASASPDGGPSSRATVGATSSPEPGRDASAGTADGRSTWPWFLGAWLGLGGVGLLVLALRRR
ncbi:WD40 repeat domain-containing protein [Nocardioides sp. KIGAM211]|uniref:WD40 repeat domain-containing protein n=1 Tax=Nocardioides luti TaxID=2761101 RepID=A0A7X0RHQ6_9ACTN|nr:WD40 repeat domain-containing protein [Nocardioides luti]MBB6627263.1 WD40 repeat domain-containing protein [Nocardioides luti]